MQFQAKDLVQAFAPAFLERGRSYHRSGRVVSAEWASVSVARGAVSGSGGNVYAVEVRLGRKGGGELRVSGSCACPVGYNCKHVAAVLLALAEPPAEPSPAPEAERPVRLSVEAWLSGVTSPGRDDDYPPNVQDRLLYLLDLAREADGVPQLTVSPVQTRQLKDGGYGVGKPYLGGEAAFVRPIDRLILQQLHATRGARLVPVLEGVPGRRLLEDMLMTGRCHWQSKDRPALRRGRERRAEFRWRSDDEGRQRLDLTGEAGLLALPLTPPWYLDPEADECGPLKTDLPEHLAGALVRAPVLNQQEADLVARRLAALPVELPRPRSLPRKTVRGVQPIPALRLESSPTEEVRWGIVPHRGLRASVRDRAHLTFDYQGFEVAAAPAAGVFSREREGVVWEIERDRGAEAALLGRLTRAGFGPGEEPGSFQLPDRDSWLVFMLDMVPALEQEGWRISVDPEFRYRVARPDEWVGEIDEQGNDWFGLSIGVSVDGERLNLLPVLARELARMPELARADLQARYPDGERTLVALEDGRLLPVAAERLREMLQVLIEFYDPSGEPEAEQLRVPRLHSAALAGLERSGPLHWQGGERLRELGAKLHDFRGIEPVEPPRGLNASLRGYQREGLSWLQFLRQYDLAGILADDMGLGKTVQTLAHLLLERESGRADRPSLVVAPTSLLGNWRREAARFTPELRVLTLHGPQRHQDLGKIGDYDLVLTTYPLLPRDLDALAAHEYHLLILDEAQHIKNPRAKAAEAASALAARHRLCLTGTPLENHLGELWSLFNFLLPGLLGSREQFARLYRTPIEKLGDDARRQRLARRIAPFMLRRTKQAVAPELPAKTELVRSVALEDDQRDLYEAVRLAMHQKIRSEINRKGFDRSRIVILDALLKLRQVCCDPRLVKLEAARQVRRSAKLEMLLDLLPNLVDEGRQILLFSQFTSMLSLIEQALKPHRIPFVKLTGQTRDRTTPIDRFQAGEVPLFLISLKAGGTGLNLTAADTVIHYDPWWNPAVEAQATDRAHRIGQQKPVFVYKLLTEGTVEERIAEMQARKAELGRAILERGDEAALTQLSGADLEALFEPL